MQYFRLSMMTTKYFSSLNTQSHSVMVHVEKYTEVKVSSVLNRCVMSEKINNK
jgi:hypothetical protein